MSKIGWKYLNSSNSKNRFNCLNADERSTVVLNKKQVIISELKIYNRMQQTYQMKIENGKITNWVFLLSSANCGWNI